MRRRLVVRSTMQVLDVRRGGSGVTGLHSRSAAIPPAVPIASRRLSSGCGKTKVPSIGSVCDRSSRRLPILLNVREWKYKVRAIGLNPIATTLCCRSRGTASVNIPSSQSTPPVARRAASRLRLDPVGNHALPVIDERCAASSPVPTRDESSQAWAYS